MVPTFQQRRRRPPPAAPAACAARERTHGTPVSGWPQQPVSRIRRFGPRTAAGGSGLPEEAGRQPRRARRACDGVERGHLGGAQSEVIRAI